MDAAVRSGKANTAESPMRWAASVNSGQAAPALSRSAAGTASPVSKAVSEGPSPTTHCNSSARCASRELAPSWCGIRLPRCSALPCRVIAAPSTGSSATAAPHTASAHPAFLSSRTACTMRCQSASRRACAEAGACTGTAGGAVKASAARS